VSKVSISNSKAGASNPLTGTLQAVPGQPPRLKIYRISASPYWQARVYVNGRYRISTLGTSDLKRAQIEAKKFFIRALVEAETTPAIGRHSKAASTGFVAVGQAFIESQNIKGMERRYNDDRIRFNKELVPFFSEKDVDGISSADIGELAKQLQTGGKSPATTNQYLIVLRKILKYANDNRLIPAVPNFPRVKGKTTVTKRDYFPTDEYKLLVSTIEEMVSEGVKVRGVPVTLEFKYLVQFMVNSFIRPSDLRVLKRQHVAVKTNSQATTSRSKHFLLLKHPATKTTDQEVVTMPAAYGIYKSHIKLQDSELEKREASKNKSKSKKTRTDHVFFPYYANRDTMIAVAGRIFRAVVQRAKLEREGEKHTFYSLRHTSIMYRLLLGSASTLELARNARTSEAMIDKHYASRLTPMMAVESLHSFKDTTSSQKAQENKVTTKKQAPSKLSQG
jgi:integrase